MAITLNGLPSAKNETRPAPFLHQPLAIRVAFCYVMITNKGDTEMRYRVTYETTEGFVENFFDGETFTRAKAKSLAKTAAKHTIRNAKKIFVENENMEVVCEFLVTGPRAAR